MFFLIRKLIKFIFFIILIVIICVCFWFLKPFVQEYTSSRSGPIAQFVSDVQANVSQFHAPAPCSTPIVFTLGTFDPSFGITKSQFIDDVNKAADVWQKPLGRSLFIYDLSTSTLGTDDLKINLIYDYRQQATNALSNVGSSIDAETKTYNSLKQKYATLTASYATQKATLTSLEDLFKAAQNTYNSEVDYWNTHGGASPSERATLDAEKNNLTAQASVISQDISAINQLVATINSTSAIINQYVTVLNSQSRQYNAISSSTGDQFEEGQYVSDATGERIDIFQYTNTTKLVRLLAHEIGHSLGLGHVTTTQQAIMYPVNQANNLTATPDDIAALKKICGIK